MKTVMTVCIGNICRSPMAAGLLAVALPDLRIHSAGTGALVGRPADAIAQKLLAERGVDISGHIAQQISQLLCRQSDLILVMDNGQRQHLERMYPFIRGKVFRIAEISKRDVPDPYREGEEAFKSALEIIEEGARMWIERIEKINKVEKQAI